MKVNARESGNMWLRWISYCILFLLLTGVAFVKWADEKTPIEQVTQTTVITADPCPENQFVIPEPSEQDIAILVERISSHPRNRNLDSRRLPVGTEIFIPDGIESIVLVVNEDNTGGFSSKARDHLRDKIRREMMMNCLKEIIYQDS